MKPKFRAGLPGPTCLTSVSERTCTTVAYRHACVCCPSTVENSFLTPPAGVAGHARPLATGTKPSITRLNVSPPWVRVMLEIWLVKEMRSLQQPPPPVFGVSSRLQGKLSVLLGAAKPDQTGVQLAGEVPVVGLDRVVVVHHPADEERRAVLHGGDRRWPKPDGALLARTERRRAVLARSAMRRLRLGGAVHERRRRRRTGRRIGDAVADRSIVLPEMVGHLTLDGADRDRRRGDGRRRHDHRCHHHRCGDDQQRRVGGDQADPATRAGRPSACISLSPTTPRPSSRSRMAT